MEESSKSSGENRGSTGRLQLALAGVAIVCVYFFGLSMPLLGPDEPRYAQVAREMFERGDWITPTLGGFNWFEKPALLYWLQIASYTIFGVSEFSARLGSAVFGLGTIASLWIIARFARVKADSSNAFANWTALIAGSTVGLIVFSRAASFDIILTFPITGAMASFFVYERASMKRHTYGALTAFYFFIGLALLAKGLVGIVFPIAIIAGYYALKLKLPPRSFLVSLLWGTALSLCIAALWYWPMYIQHGFAFIDEFIIQHHFQRFTSNKYFHPQPFYFFFWVLPLMTIPWLPFFVGAIVGHIRRAIHATGGEDPSRDSDVIALSFIWMLVPLLFFSFSGSKLPGYILPALPAAILITADTVYRFVRYSARRKIAVQLLAVSTLVVVISAMMFLVPSFADTDSVKRLIAAADASGHADAAVVSLHLTSHNAEFYAAGRLLRSADGKQKRLLGPAEVVQAIDGEGGHSILVLVPLEYLGQLTEAEYLDATTLAQNGEMAIVAAKKR